MRKITFRGKRVDNGEWVEGDLLHANNIIAILIYGCAFEVDPETVGQYTGLTDKNGKHIFEGDIVKDDKLDYRILGDNGEGNRSGISVVKFGLHEVPSDDPFCWGNAYGFYFDGETIYPTPSQYKPYDKDSQFEFEVIGNIHDNKEILDVE